MGLETSTYIDGLVTTNPTATDVMSKGDDHIRLLKSTIKASFPDVDEAVVTIHNGTTAPASKQTGTVWRDTTNSLWKFWNGSAWITLAVAFNTSNSVDVDAGTIDGVTIGGSVAPTVTDLGSVATCDLNGGTLDGMTIGASVAPTVTNIDINGGSIDGITAGTNSAITELQVDNINVNGNAITSTDTNGDVTITPNGTGEIILDGQKWPQADGSSTNYLTTNGSGQLAWTTNTVAVSEANAATSATNAATSEANALSYKNSAETAKTSAETAQTAAETALDTFDDRFLGAKASDPSVDNDGNALVDGAMYFETTNNYMKVYDLGTTTWYQLTNTTSDQTAINNCSSIQSHITTVSGISSAVTGVNNISSAVSAVNSNATNINTTSTNIASITTTANNISQVSNFASTYRIDSSDPTSSLDEGDLVFRTDTDTMRVYNGSAWQDVAPVSSVNNFGTVAVSGQSNVVADSTTDTLNIATGDASTLTVATNAGTDTVTFTGIDNSVPMAIALG